MFTLTSKSLASFLSKQVVYVFVGTIVAAVFWAIGLKVNARQLVTFVVYTVCFANFVAPSVNRLRFLYAERPFPYNWIYFLAALMAVALPAYFITGVIVWWVVPPFPISLADWLIKGWKLPLILILGFGVVRFLYETTKESLERRNAELQQLVEVGTARLEIQEQELQRARDIQQSLLPKDIPQLPGFEVAGAWQPARMVGGDYFDVLRLDDHHLAICIADVVGKGISAALLMANVQATVRAFAQATESPATVCRRVNQILCDHLATGKFVTFFYGVLNAQTHTLEYCNAGHPYPLLVSADSVRALERGGAVLGAFPAWNYEDAAVDLRAGDRLLLFTDGITEAVRSGDEEFGTKNIAAFAQAHANSSASDLTKQLLAQVTSFCGNQFQDDATLLTVAVS